MQTDVCNCPINKTEKLCLLLSFMLQLCRHAFSRTMCCYFAGDSTTHVLGLFELRTTIEVSIHANHVDHHVQRY